MTTNETVKATAGETRWVLVRAGRSGRELHAREALPAEGARGFFHSHVECGQQRSARTILALVAEGKPGTTDVLAHVTCEKCRARLEARGLLGGAR